MRRITFSCTDQVYARLNWLCDQSVRKPSNFLSLLVTKEFDIYTESMDPVKRDELIARIGAK